MASRIVHRLFMRFLIWVLIIGIAALTFFGALAAWQVFHKERIVKNELTRTTQNLADLEERQSALKTTLSALGTERGIESEVRKRFPLAKSGEETIILVDAKNEKDDANRKEKRSFWAILWDWFTP